jgi:hypothetical protein
VNDRLGSIMPTVIVTVASIMVATSPARAASNDAQLLQDAQRVFRPIEVPEDVRPALQSALDHDGPCLVDVKVNRQELRAVLSGRGDEVIDLAASNLLPR